MYYFFKEVFSHPYISFYHLLVNGFSVIYYKIYGCYVDTFCLADLLIFFFLKQKPQKNSLVKGLNRLTFIHHSAMVNFPHQFIIIQS